MFFIYFYIINNVTVIQFCKFFKIKYVTRIQLEDNFNKDFFRAYFLTN